MKVASCAASPLGGGNGYGLPVVIVLLLARAGSLCSIDAGPMYWTDVRSVRSLGCYKPLVWKVPSVAWTIDPLRRQVRAGRSEES